MFVQIILKIHQNVVEIFLSGSSVVKGLTDRKTDFWLPVMELWKYISIVIAVLH